MQGSSEKIQFQGLFGNETFEFGEALSLGRDRCQGIGLLRQGGGGGRPRRPAEAGRQVAGLHLIPPPIEELPPDAQLALRR